MDNKQIVEEYMKGRGLRRVSGKTNNLMAVLPYLMLDLQHSLYTKTIKPLDCKFRTKQLKNKWASDYTKFNKEMFDVLGKDSVDYIIEKMDSYEEYMHNYIEMLRMDLISVFEKSGVAEEKHQVLSVAITCNTIIQAANVVWKKVYVDKYGHGESNKTLEVLDKTTMLFADEYHHDSQKIDLNKDKKVVETMNLLCQKLISWVGFN